MTLASAATVFGAIAAARTVELAAYALAPNAPIVRALETAGDRGAAARVALQGHPMGPDGAAGAVGANAAVAADLRGHGVAVRLTDAAEEAVHLKAAVVDGRAYLCDRNWANDARETIVSIDDPAEVEIVRSALDGRSGGDETFSTDKSAALRLEAATIANATADRIDVETESFGFTTVSTALEARLRAGAHVRLLVCGAYVAGDGKAAVRERRALCALRALGAEVALTPATEKLCVAGTSAWVGSANQTFAVSPTLDWGLRSDDAGSAAALEARFEGTWGSARPFAAA